MISQKRYSLKNFDFKENESKHFGFPFVKKLDNPCIIENRLVIGYKTQKIRSNSTGCTLSNHVHSLLFRKSDRYLLSLSPFEATWIERDEKKKIEK